MSDFVDPNSDPNEEDDTSSSGGGKEKKQKNQNKGDGKGGKSKGGGGKISKKGNLFKQGKVGSGLKQYAKELTSLIGQGSEGPTQRFRTDQYGVVGRQTEEALRRNRLEENSNFGGNIATGYGSAQRSQISRQAPYGKANIDAENAGVNQLLTAGNSLANLGLAKGSYEQIQTGLAIQRQVAQYQAELAGAAAAGPPEEEKGLITGLLDWLI